MGEVDLYQADLAGADLSRAYLASAQGLTQFQLNDACGDEKTRLPEWLTLRPCE